MSNLAINPAIKLSIKSFGYAVLATVATMAAKGQQPAPTPLPARIIVISLQDHKLALVEDGQAKKVYTVAVGKPSTPSPVGTFTIERRVVNPTYHHGDRTVAPGPKNPVGSRWMGLSKAGYGIHGTNEPNSIGKSASHGCIRMAKADLEEFYELVAVGDQVQIIDQPDEQTARLFAPATPAATESKPATELAKAEPAAPQTKPTQSPNEIPIQNPVQNPVGATR
jgi:lipoprotein-anchoring transpeptidase ErfK/SrfK